MNEWLEDDAKELWAKLNLIHNWLPNRIKAPSNASLHQAPMNFQIWVQDKQFVGGLIKGIFGSTMGLYNTHKLN